MAGQRRVKAQAGRHRHPQFGRGVRREAGQRDEERNRLGCNLASQTPVTPLFGLFGLFDLTPKVPKHAGRHVPWLRLLSAAQLVPL